MELQARKLFDLELDLVSSDYITAKVCNNDSYAQNLYAALCNNQFVKNEVISILKEDVWHCSWRYAGEIIANIKGHGDYLDYYCTGIMDVTYDDVSDEAAFRLKQYKPEGEVTDEIRSDLLHLGWIVLSE